MYALLILDVQVGLVHGQEKPWRCEALLATVNELMDKALPQYRMLPEGNDFLTVRSIKRQIDGALGAHGATRIRCG